jgi:hypothetical protein
VEMATCLSYVSYIEFTMSILSLLLKSEKVIVDIEGLSVDRMSSETQESIKCPFEVIICKTDR